jgi:small subunit ribosomal protein S17e
MGSIRTKWIKKMAVNLVSQHPNKFNSDFENNKKILNELKILPDKSVRNRVAGYIVRVIEKEKE